MSFWYKVLWTIQSSARTTKNKFPSKYQMTQSILKIYFNHNLKKEIGQLTTALKLPMSFRTNLFQGSECLRVNKAFYSKESLIFGRFSFQSTSKFPNRKYVLKKIFLCQEDSAEIPPPFKQIKNVTSIAEKKNQRIPKQATLRNKSEERDYPRMGSQATQDDSKNYTVSLPLMLYIPGFDEVGNSSKLQYQNLTKFFDLKCFEVPSSNKNTFPEMVEKIKKYIIQESQKVDVSRPIYVAGSSLGALLAMAVSIECNDIVDRLILINPASSFPETQWKNFGQILQLIPFQISKTASLAVLPLINNFNFQFGFNLSLYQKQMQNIIQTAQNLSVDGFIWKLKCMEQGCEYMEKIGYRNIQQRTLIVSGNQDQFLPSRKEGVRLEKILPRAVNAEIKNGNHDIFSNQKVNLFYVIQDNGFYVTTRNMTSFPKNNERLGNQFGKPGPIEIPQNFEVEKDKHLFFFHYFNQMFSPTYFSTDFDENICQGLEYLPKKQQILFVGNHQPTFFDFGFVVEKILRERGQLIRALGHPSIFQSFPNEEGDNFLKRIWTKYGVVAISPKNIYKLLAMGESVLLLPGGATEAFKSQKEHQYELLWPKNAEFVRMASKFEVMIVPVSSIGAEDGKELLSVDEILSLPIIGEKIKEFNEQLMGDNKPRSWQGQGQGDPMGPFIGPLFVPGPPYRYYTKFGKPIKTKKEWVKDKQMCSEVYNEVKSEVEKGINYLQQKKSEDPYRDLIPRLLFQSFQGREKPPPTFKV